MFVRLEKSVKALDEAATCSRRGFLKAAAAAAGATLGLAQGVGAAKLSGATAQESDLVLVIIRLAGGNDGLNTVVPFFDDQYYRHRPTLAIAEKDTLPLETGLGLHADLMGLKSLYDSGELTIVQGVGTPHPHRSHRRANMMWRTGTDNESETTSWMERYLATSVNGGATPDEHAYAKARRLIRSAPSSATETFSSQLQAIAKLIAADDPTKLYEVTLTGFDTHASQLAAHSHLLKSYGNAMQDFITKLSRQGSANRVITVTYTEFGRRPAENPAAGTDHGHAAPVFITGHNFPGGLIGKHPILGSASHAQLRPTTDYRNVIAMITNHWNPHPQSSRGSSSKS